ncbi:hypothetical protein CFC21_038439 [Triticum aestivum]|uniref:Protein kinase domain-containing protein n=2 Tax=Triticum aestivum TaxID=4565 RepID=A0A3B6EUY1_WHEAT|nr:uncharacterized protein LOC123063580 [Triticum aestivum]KAF7026324.1 hypothetical protein CFC21_038439 [Triticum aestivum]
MRPRRSPSAGRSSPESSNASQSSGSQSSGGMKNPDGSIPIPFTIHRGNPDRLTGLGSSYLEMPSGQENINLTKEDYPKLVLVIKDDDENQQMCLKIMKSLTHENVLGVHFWEKVEEGPYIRVHVEPYTASISTIISEAESLVDRRSKLVPSPAFEEIVSASIDGLDYIRESGYYHGNFSWETTLYHQEADKIVVKLANFEIKGPSLVECQVEDCISLAASLEWASQKVKKEYPNVKPHTCYIIDDLIRILKSFTMNSVHTMKLQLKDHEFFWNSKRKKIFFAYDVPQVFKNDLVKQKFAESPSMPDLPWTATWPTHELIPGQLMKHMLIYRGNNGLGSYNASDVEEFLRFISGMYSHENELKEKIPNLNVNKEVQRIYPCLWYDLKKAIRDAEEQADNAMAVDN